MSESATHIGLIDGIDAFVRSLVGARTDLLIYRDGPDSNPQTVPAKIRGFRPDVLAKTWRDERFYIGEAKTEADLQTRHSREQLAAFVREVAERRGGTLILSVPLTASAAARALLWSICDDESLLAERMFCIHPALHDATRAQLRAR